MSRTRGRHVRRTPLLQRLLPGRRRREHVAEVAALTVDVRTLEDEVDRLRRVEAGSTAAAVVVELRLQQAERALAEARAEAGGLRAELAAVRAELAGVREELVWAFAERRVAAEVAGTAGAVGAAGAGAGGAPAVIDLTGPRAATA